MKHNYTLLIPPKRLPFLFPTLIILMALFGTGVLLFVRSEKLMPAVGKEGGVATENQICSQMGLNILKVGGSAVDSAIVSALCIGIVHPFHSGIGGGGFMTVKDSNGDSIVFNFRESAPKASYHDMFVKDPNASTIGGLSVAIPGEVKGFYEAHKRFGRLSWKSLFLKASELAKNGFVVSKALETYVEMFQKDIFEFEGLREIFAPNGKLVSHGDVMRRENYANVLEEIALNGPDAFYFGSIASDIVTAVQASGGIIEMEDLHNYSVEIQSPLIGYYKGFKVYAPPSPASGSILLSMLNLMEGYRFDVMEDINAHRFIETCKFAYAQRSYLGDPHFATNTTHFEQQFIDKETSFQIRFNISDNHTFPASHYGSLYESRQDAGTSHISVIDKYGQAVSLTTTINTEFGSRVVARGILLNNEMDDFSQPNSSYFGLKPSPFNYIEPGKRPLSSMVPVILEGNDAVISIGGAGGSRITSAVVLTLLRYLETCVGLANAISYARMHHQLFPHVAFVERGICPIVKSILASRGHAVEEWKSYKSIVHAVVKGERVEAFSDPRTGGLAEAY